MAANSPAVLEEVYLQDEKSTLIFTPVSQHFKITNLFISPDTTWACMNYFTRKEDGTEMKFCLQEHPRNDLVNDCLP